MATTSPSAAHPGWLLIDPAGYPCEWHRHDPAADVDQDAVWARIGGGAAYHKQLRARGFAVVCGGGEQLCRTTPIARTAQPGGGVAVAV
jgi:hypothetical protein